MSCTWLQIWCVLQNFLSILNTLLKEILITNIGNHDAVLSPNWNWIDWNYGEKRGRKRGMKVSIITHFARMQQFDEFSALFNVGKDYGYSLGSQTDHDLCYVFMNLKIEKERSVKIYRAEMGTKL